MQDLVEAAGQDDHDGGHDAEACDADMTSSQAHQRGNPPDTGCGSADPPDNKATQLLLLEDAVRALFPLWGAAMRQT